LKDGYLSYTRFENRLYPTFTEIDDRIVMAFLHRLGSNFQALKQTSLASCSDFLSTRGFRTSSALQWVIPQTRLNVVDDSELGRRGRAQGKIPKVIGINGQHTRRGPRRYAQLGDKVTVAVAGEVKWGYIVGCKAQQRPLVPRYDSNNVVLTEKNGTPLGKRVLVPIPSSLRRKADGEFSKIIAMSSKFF